MILSECLLKTAKTRLAKLVALIYAYINVDVIVSYEEVTVY